MMTSNGVVKYGDTYCPTPIVKKNVKPRWEKSFPVIGQGVVVFNANRSDPFSICVQDKNGEDWISLDVHNNSAVFYMKHGKSVLPLTMVTGRNCGLQKELKISYWFSYDRDNLVLKYGKGYRMEQTTIMTYDFLDGKSPAKVKEMKQALHPFFNAEVKKYAKLYDTKKAMKKVRNQVVSVIDAENEVEFDKHPFIRNIPPLVLDSSKVTLSTLDEGKFTFSASLPPACQELYENVKGCELDCPDEHSKLLLSDAIRHSINTKGCMLYQKLKEKAGSGPSSNPKQTYLRITLGHCIGKSPGIPYVLEIWPSGHNSPIHSHGNSSAVIKVLFGSIHAQAFNKQTNHPDEAPLVEFDAMKGDIMFMTKNWYQTHKLINITDDYCATIQCYNYDSGENVNWPYFDYVSEPATIKHFVPNSDLGFQEMQKTVFEEYTRHISPAMVDDIDAALTHL